jgi:signal transduction histidine kinase
MSRSRFVICCTGVASAVVLAGIVVGVATRTTSLLLSSGAGLVAVGTGWLVVRHSPRSPVGPAVAWSSACVVLVEFHNLLSASADTAEPLPLAGAAAQLGAGVWPINLLGFFALLLVFPDGPRRGRGWSLLPLLYVMATAATGSGMWGTRQLDGQVVGDAVGHQVLLAALGMLMTGVSLVLAVVSLAGRFRRGDVRSREQIRWLMLSAVVVVALLMAGWAAHYLDAPLPVAYGPFLVGIVVLVPLAVGVAVLRHDLYDVDRVLGESATMLVTVVLSAGVFGMVVLAVSQVVNARTAIGSTTAAFVTALVLLPLHRSVHRAVSRMIDPDRHVAVAAAQRFAADVSAGRREPEEVEEVLRAAQSDPGLAVALASPDGLWVTVDGSPATVAEGFTLESRREPIARIVLGRQSARARRRIADLARAVWVPLEVCRLRLVLRVALEEATASRARFAEATALERRRWERDLHDGAQQRLIAVGMRLRLLQRGLSGELADEVDSAVAELQACVDELRRLAHGVRPSRLDDGLAAALATVREATPLPFDLMVADLPPIDEARSLTAYLVVAEAVANALKHADATRIAVRVTGQDDRIAVDIRDNGVGGVPPGAPLSALRDRVLSVGGLLSIDSPPGQGTTVSAVI